MRENIKSPIEFIREILRSALWDVGYYERELTGAHERISPRKKDNGERRSQL